jgi:hypothetical protein
MRKPRAAGRAFSTLVWKNGDALGIQYCHTLEELGKDGEEEHVSLAVVQPNGYPRRKQSRRSAAHGVRSTVAKQALIVAKQTFPATTVPPC